MKIDIEAFIRNYTKIGTPALAPEVELHLAGEDINPLWKATLHLTGNVDHAPPFWAYAWPGGQALARYVLDNPEVVRGLRVLDFGAGSGLGAIAAAKAGAKKVWTSDVDPLAQTAIQMNASHNKVAIKEMGLMYLKEPTKKFDLIMAGDVCYEHALGNRAVKWLRLCAEKGVRTLLADPGRGYAPKEGIKEVARMTVPTSRELEDSDTRDVTIWEFVTE